MFMRAAGEAVRRRGGAARRGAIVVTIIIARGRNPAQLFALPTFPRFNQTDAANRERAGDSWKDSFMLMLVPT